ncbi:hypothetical protein FI667_g15791, partial [Globisporangium splendens]
MVESKYYYAGGCCRSMFYYTTVGVKRELDVALESTTDIATISTTGHRASSSINRLFALFKRPNWGGNVSPVISEYVAASVAITCGPEAIKKFMSTQRYASNPALDGWMLEMVFFASLRNGGIELVDAAGNNVGSWNQSSVVVADGIPQLSPTHAMWIKPEKWNQGGYDAIMVSRPTQHVRFVQVTSAHKHSFRIEHFHRWLNMLSKSPGSFEVKTMEIIFVVEQDKLRDFQISTVTGQGLLLAFGWQKNKETERVQLVDLNESETRKCNFDSILSPDQRRTRATFSRAMQARRESKQAEKAGVDRNGAKQSEDDVDNRIAQDENEEDDDKADVDSNRTRRRRRSQGA